MRATIFGLRGETRIIASFLEQRQRQRVARAHPAIVEAGIQRVGIADDDVDAGEIEILLAQRPEPGIHVGHRRVQLRHAGVDQHARIGMVDDVHVDRHPLALGEQVGNADWRDGD